MVHYFLVAVRYEMVLDSFDFIRNKVWDLKFELWNMLNTIILTLSLLKNLWYIYAPKNMNRIVAIYRKSFGPEAMSHNLNKILYY